MILLPFKAFILRHVVLRANQVIKHGIYGATAIAVSLLFSICFYENREARKAIAVAELVTSSGGESVMTSTGSGEEFTGKSAVFGVRLTELHLGRFPKMNDVVAATSVGQNPNVNIKNLRLTSGLLTESSRLGTIRVLAVDSADIGDREVSEFARRCPLRAVGISHTNCTAIAVRELSRCSTITSLGCNGLAIGDDSVEDISRLHKLSHLDVANTNVTLVGVRRLCEIPTLQVLRIHGLGIDCRDVELLKRRFPGLRIIDDEFEI